MFPLETGVVGDVEGEVGEAGPEDGGGEGAWGDAANFLFLPLLPFLPLVSVWGEGSGGLALRKDFVML